MIALEAGAWGAIAASSLVIGALIAILRPIARKPLGLIMAFGSGVLVSSVAYELVEEAVRIGGQLPMALGLALGTVVFYLGDNAIDSMGAEGIGSVNGPESPESGLAIVLGAALDGIPESIVLGLTIVISGSVSAAFLVAVALSNVPEAVAATSGLARSGWSGACVLGLWTLVSVVSGAAALLGFAVFDTASPTLVAFVLAFAAGAILTMLADTMMPEAFEHAGPVVGVVTTFGFALAFALSALE